MKTVCIIPARGGSKRIPRKNIIDFNGKPLIAWSIETAIESKLFDQVIVSTEDDEIASIATAHGAEVPFRRSANLADDHTTTADVLLDVLKSFDSVEKACCLYPTAPMVRPDDLVQADRLLGSSDVDCVISVTEFDFHPLRAFSIGAQGTIDFHWPEYALTRSQDLPEMIHDAGAFYMFKADAFDKQKKLVMEKTLPLMLPPQRVMDIDTPQDLKLAKTMHSLSLKKNSLG